MVEPLTDLRELLRAMEPLLNDGTYVYSSLPDHDGLRGLEPVATLREAEGLTVVAEESAALAHGLPVLFRAAWITLTVHSDLQAVGLTAAVATALAAAGIPCNVIAGARHDHLFVPVERALEAMAALQALQQSGPA